jgi:hypothetical protein
VLRDGTCLSVTGSFAPFKEVGAYHLRSLLRAAGVTDALEDKADAVLGGCPQLWRLRMCTSHQAANDFVTAPRSGGIVITKHAPLERVSPCVGCRSL